MLVCRHTAVLHRVRGPAESRCGSLREHKTLLDGRYVQQDCTGTMTGHSFAGIGLFQRTFPA